MTFQSQSTEKLNLEILSAYIKDPILAARQLFPHWFSRPMPWFHRGLIAILLRRADFLLNFEEEIWSGGSCRWTKKKLSKLVRCFTYALNPADPYGPRAPIFRLKFGEDGRTPISIDMVLGTHVNFIIPRGFAKTTIVNFTNLYKILFQLTRLTVYISEAAAHAKDQLATLRRELSSNEKIIALFGILKPDRTDDESWGAESFETTTGIKVVAKGRGAQIRGINKFGDRPDTIVLDDVEDKESVTTEPQRYKTSSWYKSDVEQALRRDFSSQSCIYAIGTLLHPKSLLAELAKQSEYTTIQFGGVDPDGEALWDDKAGMSLEALEAKRQSFAAMGQLFQFGLEFLSTIRDEDRVKFKREYIRYQTMKTSDFIARSIHIDPAISAKRGADYCALAVVGITEKGHKHVLDFFCKRGMPMSEQAEKYFELKIKWDCTHHSSESVAYQAALAQVIRELMFIKAKTFGTKAYFEIRDTWPQGRKVERVEGILQPIMAAGYLTFQQIWPELEVMFLDWPDAELDGPDAIAGAVSNLEPFAPLSYGDGEALGRELDDPIDFIAPCQAGSGVVP
jgi:hypothetical protein